MRLHRLECAKALLRAGADPNFVNKGGAWPCSFLPTPPLPCFHAPKRINCSATANGKCIPSATLCMSAPSTCIITCHVTHGAAGDLVLFWAIDGGVDMVKELVDYGADLNARWVSRPAAATAVELRAALGHKAAAVQA